MTAERAGPVVQARSDTDFYKITMGYYIWKRYPVVPVTFRFINRSRHKGVRIADVVDGGRLREELEHARALRWGSADLLALAQQGFPEDFLAFLSSLVLPEISVDFSNDDDIKIEARGPWATATHWEMPVLQIMSELYVDGCAKREGLSETDLWRNGERRALEKFALLAQYPDIHSTEFGTRRRRSFRWQKHLLEMVQNEYPLLFAGTSNVLLARILNFLMRGTMAHELFMVAAALARDDDAALRASQKTVLREWEETFGGKFTIALSDTFGTRAFLDDFVEFAPRWKGVRHDSGNPFAFVDTMVRYYGERIGVDPRSKTAFCSDALTAPLITHIHRHSRNQIGDGYGWGTNLTNDTGFPMPSLAMKVVEAGGFPAVKLSDNPSKATGDPAAVARYQRVFQPGDLVAEECRY